MLPKRNKGRSLQRERPSDAFHDAAVVVVKIRVNTRTISWLFLVFLGQFKTLFESLGVEDQVYLFRSFLAFHLLLAARTAELGFDPGYLDRLRTQ